MLLQTLTISVIYPIFVNNLHSEVFCNWIFCTGRGDVGKQFAAGALGFGIFAPIIGGAAAGIYLDAMICFTVLMAIAVIILLVD